jgi:hypothetical protein
MQSQGPVYSGPGRWAAATAAAARLNRGHGTDPYEQNTQQSPAFGQSMTPHPAHSWKNTQASVVISSHAAWPHSGQRSRDLRVGEDMGTIYLVFAHTP